MVEYSLAELCICAGADIFSDEHPEVFATLIGIVPRLGGSLAKASFLPGMMMSDGEYYFVSEPVPLGRRDGYQPKKEGRIGYERVFDLIAKGNRHAFVSPVQVDRFGQMNLSVIGDYDKPKVTMLGVRGLPGNTVNNRTSMFIPRHDRRSFVADEVDMVSGAGYNPARYPNAEFPPGLDLRRIITNLCVLDFKASDHALRVKSLHPGVKFEEVQDHTGFELVRSETLIQTPAPTVEQLEIIARLDPHNLRASVFKDNPSGRR